MLKKENIENYLNKNISVGVPHLVIDDRLFFFYGILINVSETEITIKTKNGYKIIPIEQIQDLHENKNRGDVS